MIRFPSGSLESLECTGASLAGLQLKQRLPGGREGSKSCETEMNMSAMLIPARFGDPFSIRLTRKSGGYRCLTGTTAAQAATPALQTGQQLRYSQSGFAASALGNSGSVTEEEKKR